MMDDRYSQNRGRKSGRRSNSDIPRLLPENPCQKKIAAWLKKLKLRRVIFGGVSEKQVWKCIGELNAMYQDMLEVERARYEALLYRHGITADDADPGNDAGGDSG